MGDDRVVLWGPRLQRHMPTTTWREQFAHHAEAVLVLDWEIGELLGSTVALCGEILNVRLISRQAHGIFALGSRGGRPFRVIG